MTIPLDNLYDYIHSLVKEIANNVLMYRFYPNGSKEIKNLLVMSDPRDYKLYSPVLKKTVMGLNCKILICYDQEPLNYNLYENNFEKLKKVYEKYDPLDINYFTSCPIILQKFISRNNLASHPDVALSVYDKKLLLHSEKNSEDLRRYKNNGYIDIHYWSHAFIALDWYRFAKHDRNSGKFFVDPFQKDFNIYCRGWTGTREYRLKFLSMLSKLNISQNSNIFFNEYDDNNKHFSDVTLNNKNWRLNKNEKIAINELNSIKNKNSNPTLSAVYDLEDYKKSAIDVVLETCFDQNKIHLTEKILRPIACGKPFILVSGKNSLKYLQSYGFKTFGELIDEKYDSIECPKKRLKYITETMKEISNLPEKEKKQLFINMHKIAEENKKWFFSENFFDLINNELIRNLTSAIRILDNPDYQTAKEPRLLYRAYKMYYQYLSGIEKEQADLYISETPERIKLSKKNIGIS